MRLISWETQIFFALSSSRVENYKWHWLSCGRQECQWWIMYPFWWQWQWRIYFYVNIVHFGFSQHTRCIKKNQRWYFVVPSERILKITFVPCFCLEHFYCSYNNFLPLDTQNPAEKWEKEICNTIVIMNWCYYLSIDTSLVQTTIETEAFCLNVTKTNNQCIRWGRIGCC